MNNITRRLEAFASIGGAPSREQVQAVQDRLIAAGADTQGPPVEHFFGDGIYGRLMEIPPHVFLIGKTHRKAGITIQIYGDTEVSSPGIEPVRITGHHVWESEAGTKRMIYAHVPSLWIALHATNETDLDAVEADLIEPDRMLEKQS